MNFEAPLTSLVWLTSFVSVALTFLVSYLLVPRLGGDLTLWWKLSLIITCGTLAGAVIPELVKVFTSTESAHVREVVTASREGGASLNVLSGLTAGNFSAFWMGTAVVGATTMIFSIIMVLTDGLTTNMQYLTILHAPFLLGLIVGGAVIYWFTGASIQAVSTGAYRAVEFIKANIKLEGVEKASIADSKRVVEICTQYAQRGMINIFLTVFCCTLAFACLEPFFFIGYLISIALFGLFQAIFMANAGGAWDNAKKLVEVDLKEKGTELHAASVVGDTVGDP